MTARKRAVPLPDGAWKWLPAVAITPPEEIVRSRYFFCWCARMTQPQPDRQEWARCLYVSPHIKTYGHHFWHIHHNYVDCALTYQHSGCQGSCCRRVEQIELGEVSAIVRSQFFVVNHETSIPPNDFKRYAAHIVVVYLLTCECL